MEHVVGCVFFGLNEIVFPFMVIEVYSCSNCRKVTHIVWSKCRNCCTFKKAVKTRTFSRTICLCF